MKVVFHEDFYQSYTMDPAAEVGRMEAIVSVIADKVEFITPDPATEEDLLAVHSRAHLERIKQQGLHEIAALAAGGALLSATIGLEEPCFGLVRPPGHHASRDSCWGFCFYNNMALALETLLRTGRIQQALVLDIDLHYGDGTVNILGHREDVCIHNVESPDRRGYLDEVQRILEETPADLIGISAGFDNHEQDWGMLLKTADYTTIARSVRAAARRLGAGCFALLEGGYSHRVLGHNVMALLEGLDA